MQADAQVAAAVARPVEPAAPFARRKRLSWSAAAVAIAVIFVAALEITMAMSLHRAGCRAVDAVVKEIYQGRGYLLVGDEIGPGGPPLSQYQQWADSIRRHATEADDDPAAAPHLDRIADLAAQAVTAVEMARQHDSVTPQADNQSTISALSINSSPKKAPRKSNADAEGPPAAAGPRTANCSLTNF